MKLSIATTLFYSTNNIEEFYHRIVKILKEITTDYEIIFVNDGSPDDSVNKAINLFNNDKKVKIIDLSKNFGHHKAMMTALSFCEGDYIFLIDSDLEEEPENLKLFWKKYFEDKNTDVVFGVVNNRKGTWFEKFSGYFFYRMLSFLSDKHIADYTAVSRLMNKNYVKDLIRFKESEIYLPGLWYITGYNQKSICINKKPNSKSSYTLKKKLQLSVNAITSFSNKPLIYIFNLGCIIVIFATLGALYLIIKKLFFGGWLGGWASLIVSLWMIGGLTFLFLGIIGIYISKIFIESKNRPFVIIKKIYKHNNS